MAGGSGDGGGDAGDHRVVFAGGEQIDQYVEKDGLPLVRPFFLHEYARYCSIVTEIKMDFCYIFIRSRSSMSA